jgi:hypothetical protein
MPFLDPAAQRAGLQAEQAGGALGAVDAPLDVFQDCGDVLALAALL